MIKKWWGVTLKHQVKAKGCEVKLSFVIPVGQNTFPVNRVGLLKVDLKGKELQV